MKPVLYFYANDVPETAKSSKWKLFTIVPMDFRALQNADDSRLDESACLAVKNIGKPCAGKPLARIDEGGLSPCRLCLSK
jgi:hypothetical protein